MFCYQHNWNNEITESSGRHQKPKRGLLACDLPSPVQIIKILFLYCLYVKPVWHLSDFSVTRRTPKCFILLQKSIPYNTVRSSAQLSFLFLHRYVTHQLTGIFQKMLSHTLTVICPSLKTDVVSPFWLNDCSKHHFRSKVGCMIPHMEHRCRIQTSNKYKY